MTGSHKTAKTRKKASEPMRYLEKQGVIVGERLLDYGCGKGFDAEKYVMDKYDPYYWPLLPDNNTYDFVACSYVLNVIPENEAEEVIESLRRVLKKGGKAYIIVRRDVKKDGITLKGTL